MKFAKSAILASNMPQEINCPQALVLKERVDKLEEGLNTKVSQEIFKELDKSIDNWNKVYIAIIFAIVSSIGGLYILYFSGISELKIDVAVIKSQVSSINKILGNSEIIK